jgi:hypothetical protein
MCCFEAETNLGTKNNNTRFMEVDLTVDGINLTAILDDVTQELLDVAVGNELIGEHLTDWFTERIEMKLEERGYMKYNNNGEECVR